MLKPFTIPSLPTKFTVCVPCQNCEATGAIPSLDTRFMEGLSEYCPDCLEQGICPQCGIDWCENSFAAFDAFINFEINAFKCPHCNTQILE
jgi:hypothetical protein